MTYQFIHPTKDCKVIIEKAKAREWEWWEEDRKIKGVVLGGKTGICTSMKECMAEAGVTLKNLV